MGIQRFGLRMRDYAIRTTLGSTDSSGQESIAIIDGPGLAHYIYYGLCDKALTSSITYRECADSTKAWLDKLQQHGFKIEAVLFDGALPPSKKDVRIDRLQGYINRLSAFKQASTSSLSSLNGQGRKSLPPPPFLVFAIVEELLRSTYAGVTFVVPGEADPYCVAAAQSLPTGTGSITIFSDDADLMVYRVNQNCRIIPFRDLSESETASGVVLTGEAYKTSDIVNRYSASIQDLVKPAYYMSLDHHCSLEKAMRMTASSNPELRRDFQDFAKSFETTQEAKMLTEIRTNSTLKDALASRDSRVSELVYQVQSEEPGGLRMYLPFISDDPTRASAWNIGAETRLLAYSALLQAHDLESSIQEYKRSGPRVASSLLEPLSSAVSLSLANTLEHDIAKLKDTPVLGDQSNRAHHWRYLIMRHMLSHLIREDQAMPGLDEIVQIIMNREPRKWQHLHLHAQYQAAFYSLRLLKQLLANVVEQTGDSEWIAAVTALHAQLSDLPTISVFFDDRTGVDRRREQDMWRTVLNNLVLSFSRSESEGEQKQARPKKKAKKRKGSAADNPHVVRNSFAMLAE